MQTVATALPRATPRQSEHKGVGPLGSKSHDYRLDHHYLDAQAQESEGVSGALNPDWVETLMGYPIGYTMPEGEPMRELPNVWPSGGNWPTPSHEGFDRGGDDGPHGASLPQRAKKAQGWPAGLGAPQHEWEPPRLTTERTNRANRLKALGNSIVPQVARLWMEAIAEDANGRS